MEAFSLQLAGLVLGVFASAASFRVSRWTLQRRYDLAALEAVRSVVSGLGAIALMQWGASV